MKLSTKHLLPFIALAASFTSSFAQDKPGSGTVPTNWPGIDYDIAFINRIPPDRLVVGVLIVANAKAPSTTLIGLPPNAAPGSAGAMRQGSIPLSLDSSTMIEDATQQKYPVLDPIAPPGKIYPAGEVLCGLRPGDGKLLTIQFAAPPPPPPPAPGQLPPKQTVSFLLPNSKGPITKMILPPPTPDTASSAPSAPAPSQ